MPRPGSGQREEACPILLFRQPVAARRACEPVCQVVVKYASPDLSPAAAVDTCSGSFPAASAKFVDKAFQRESRLQRIDGAHPAQRHRSFGHHVFDRVVRDSVNRSGLVGKIGIDIVRNGLPLLPR